MPRIIANSVVVGIDAIGDGQSGCIIAILLVELRVRSISLRRGVVKATVSSIREALVTWLLSSAQTKRSNSGWKVVWTSCAMVCNPLLKRPVAHGSPCKTPSKQKPSWVPLDEIRVVVITIASYKNEEWWVWILKHGRRCGFVWYSCLHFWYLSSGSLGRWKDV